MIGAYCEHCGRVYERASVAQFRSERNYCSLRCNGKAKSWRMRKTKAQRVAEKAAYDRLYRQKHIAKKKAYARDYFRRTYDPVKARRERRKKMRWHVQYCRKYYSDPRRKAEKVAYDAARRASAYGEYAEAFKLLLVLQKQVLAQCPDKYERLKARGYYERQNEKQRERRRHVET